MRILVIILASFTTLLIILGTAYAHASLNAYNTILIIFISFILFCIGTFALMSMAIFYTFKRKKAVGTTLALTKAGLKVLLPVAVFFTKPNSREKKSIRDFYIELNNIIVESHNKKYKAEDIMLLLPHCLQNSRCQLKITSNPELCKRCGMCKIGSLTEYAGSLGISLFVATGGTVARNIIKKAKPKIIISVACERDLMSGISDVKDIPVIGILNRQPNGPCINTDVDIDNIIQRISRLAY